MTQYIALIHKDADSEFGVSFPDFPGCITAGATLDEARAMAAEALALHLEGMAEEKLEISPPSDLDAIMADPENRDGVVLLVDIVPPASEKPVAVNITLRPSDLARFDQFAKARGFTRSGFLAAAARRMIDAGESAA